jgi:diguanylate cyclase (GGDEF)-like protein/PAS domain S-box-containing protein
VTNSSAPYSEADLHSLPQWAADIVPSIAKLSSAACVIGADETFLYVNAAYYAKTARTPTDVVGKRLVEVNDADSYDIVQPKIARALATKRAMSFGREWRAADGSKIWVDFQYLPHLDIHGEVLGFTAFAIEKHHLSQANSNTIERERLLRQLSNSAGSPILYVDRDFIVRFVNQPLLDWIGKSESDVIGQHASSVFSPEAFQFYKPMVLRALQGETTNLEAPSKGRTGEQRQIKFTVIPDRRASNDITGVFISAIDIDDDFKRRQALIERERQLQLFTDNIPEAVVYLDTSRRYKFVNNTFVRHRGVHRDDIIGKYSYEVLGIAVAEFATPHVERAFAGETVIYERLVTMHDGDARWYRMRAVPDFSESNEVQGIYVVGIDIHDAKLAQDQLSKDKAELRHANWLLTSHFENTPLAAIEWDSEMRVRRWTAQAEKVFGWTEQEVIGKHFSEWQFVYEDDMTDINVIAEQLRSTSVARTSTLNRNYRKDGSVIWVEWYNSSLNSVETNVASVFSLAQDITDRMHAEERLLHQATHDNLTGLPNRTILHERVGQAIMRARRSGDKVAALFIDLDRFKDVNDTLGHRIGDELLREMARRLNAAIRESDLLVRLSGDEFMVILEQFTEQDAPSIVAQKLLDEMRAANIIEGNEIYIAGSIGISIFPDDANDVDTLLKNADMAMYRAKESGKNTYQAFSEDMAEHSGNMRLLENALRHAITRNELVLHYQPKIEMATNRIIGAEALLRWQHPTRGLIMPSEFIHLAEESGLVHDIGLWVLEHALAQMRQWQTEHAITIKIAINLSAGQFRALNLAEKFADRIAQAEIEASLLEVEVTETGLIRDPEGVGRILEALRELGISIAIDDFGTGYSSLSHLKRFPIDTLKIDQSFVADLLIDADDRAIVSAVIALAHALEINVVAEGVETIAQRDMLERMGCNMYQGYLFAKPCTAKDFLALLK